MEWLMVGSFALLAAVVYLVSRAAASAKNDATATVLIAQAKEQAVEAPTTELFAPHVLAVAEAINRIKAADPGAADAFEEMMDALAERHDGDWFHARVAGVAYYNDDGSSRQAAIKALTPGDLLQLEPDPESEFDPNAIRVLTEAGDQIGFLGSRLAGEVSRGMKARVGYMAVVASIDPEQNVEALGVHFGLMRFGG